MAVTSISARDQYLSAMFTGLVARGPVEAETVEAIESALSLDGVGVPSLSFLANHRAVVVAGSGKKNVRSPNVSTPSAIVAAAAGANIVKVGSHSTSSALGSRDLAIRLGIPQRRSATEVDAALSDCSYAFVPIEDVIPTLDRIYGGRFHIVNPLSFGLAALAAPVRGDAVVYGLAHPRVDLAARVLRTFGVHNAFVVTSETKERRYVDEFGMGARSLVCKLRDGEVEEPVVYGTDRRPGNRAWPSGGVAAPLDTEDAVQMTTEALAGRSTRDHLALIAWNAALMLVAGGVTEEIENAYDLACSTIKDGQATKQLAVLTGGAE